MFTTIYPIVEIIGLGLLLYFKRAWDQRTFKVSSCPEKTKC